MKGVQFEFYDYEYEQDAKYWAEGGVCFRKFLPEGEEEVIKMADLLGALTRMKETVVTM